METKETGRSAVRDYPESIVPVDHVEQVPRRIRGVLNGVTVFDTTRALYVWEWPKYPHYYIPSDDIDAETVVDEDHPEPLRHGNARRYGLRVGEVEKTGVAHLFAGGKIEALAGMMRIDWAALDAWYEEDEQVFVHPRDPYTRVDAIRSTRQVRIELDGVVLAESSSPVLVFETGLPTRYYLNRTEVRFEHLQPSETVSSCPYKGQTTRYWSVAADEMVQEDVAWTYEFPTAAVLPIAGLIALYNEKVDIFLDGELLERPQTHFSSSAKAAA
jgi:uncharacterized protein (DUF427 family)